MIAHADSLKMVENNDDIQNLKQRIFVYVYKIDTVHLKTEIKKRQIKSSWNGFVDLQAYYRYNLKAIVQFVSI